LPYFFSINLLSPFIRGSVFIIVVLSSLAIFVQRPLLTENACDNSQFKSISHHSILYDILGYYMYRCHMVFWIPWIQELIFQGFKKSLKIQKE